MNKSRHLTENDTVVLADFANSTGDPGTQQFIASQKRVCEGLISPRLRKDESAPMTVSALSPPVPLHLLGK
jgi:hypothetical protein